MAARFAAAGDALGRLVRERQDAVEERRELDEQLLAALALPPEERDLAALQDSAAAMDGRIDGLDAELRERFPEYAEMVGQRPQPLSEIQRQLGDDEALVAFAVWGDRTFVWGVRGDRVHAFFAMLGEKELSRAVRKLRRGLKVADPRGRRCPSSTSRRRTTSITGCWRRWPRSWPAPAICSWSRTGR